MRFYNRVTNPNGKTKKKLVCIKSNATTAKSV